MHITPEQILIAEARGCRFQTATAGQLHTLAMQRRIFWHGDQALVAVRGDGFYETAATLQQLLDLPGPLPERPAAVTVVPADDDGPPEPPPADQPLVRPTLPGPLAVDPRPEPRTSAMLPAGSSAALALTAEMVSRLVEAGTVKAQDLPDLIRGIHGSVMTLTGSRGA